MTDTYLFIDGSNFSHTRFHSIMAWAKNTKTTDPDEIVDKFRKMFVQTLRDIPRRLNLTNPIIIVANDCKRSQIWRKSIYPQYKADRDKKDNTVIKHFFKIIRNENLFTHGGAHSTIYHAHLEADDCIALSVKQLLSNGNKVKKIIILSSDRDFLQLLNYHDNVVELYDLQYRGIAATGKDLFCKILAGDTSDSIPSVFPRCGPKTAIKYYDNLDMLNEKLESNPEYKANYERNKTLIDFNYIPADLIEEFYSHNI